jgi:RNase P protein component
MRRRVRAVLQDLDRCSTLPPGLLLIGGRPSSIELTFDQLMTELTEITEQIRRLPVSNA